MKITRNEMLDALSEMAQSRVNYPLKDGETKYVTAPLIDWFDLDAQDAMDFGVLSEPKFDGYSDIAIMQMEWYVEKILEGPFLKALEELGIEVIE